MTGTEREEKGNSSNTNLVEIKKEQIEEEGINLWLLEPVKDSKEEDEEEDAEEESERSTKRTRITESDEVESTAANAEVDVSKWGIDPLEVTEKIVVKYHDFIHEIYQMLKDEQKEDEQMEVKKVKIQWEKWKEILERAKVLVETLNEGLRTLALEMEWMESIDEFEKQYALRELHVPDLIALLRDINKRIESSPYFRVVSDMKNRDEVLTMCLGELEKSKEELTEMVGVIQELKELDLRDDADGEGESLLELEDIELEDDGEDDGEDELVLELEDHEDEPGEDELEGDEYEELDLQVDEKKE